MEFFVAFVYGCTSKLASGRRFEYVDLYARCNWPGRGEKSSRMPTQYTSLMQGQNAKCHV